MAKLIINPTSGARKEIPLGDKILSIGRDPSNDLVLSDSMVSRRHAIMERRGDEYVIRDNNSSNGTLVNGDRVVGDQTLGDGDLIAIGSARLLFHMDSEEAEPPGIAAVTPPASKTTEAGAQESGKACPACGLGAAPSDRFCRRCGAEISTEKSRQVSCGHCHASVELPAEFCGACGKPLESVPGSAPVRSSSDLEDRITRPRTPLVPATPKVPRPPPASGREGPAGERIAGRPSAGSSVSLGISAGFWIRFAAYLIDSFILMIPMLVLMGISVPAMVRSAQSGQVDPSSSWILFLPALGGLLTAVLSIVYPLFFWTTRGATPGKRLLGLQVVTLEGKSPIGMKQAVLRLIGYMINGFTFGIGFLLIALSEDRRGLHDRIAETAVFKRR